MVKGSIKKVMATYKEKKFSIIGHSVGCHIAYYIQDEIDPTNQNLRNVICMGTPLGDSPTKLNKGVEKVMTTLKAKQ
jgi:triacylglycerol esterase/lipase EstA (alpha/beta hydrolase family)